MHEASPLRKVQFGWRFAPMVFFSSLLLLSSVLHEGLTAQPRFPKGLRVGLVSCILVFFLGGSIAWLTRFPPTRHLLSEVSQDRIASHEAREYRTRHNGAGWVDYYQRGGFEGECSAKGVQCVETAHTPLVREWLIRSPKEVKLILPMFWFPAWLTSVEGAPVSTRPEPTSGLIEIPVRPSNNIKVRIEWQMLWQERVGAIGSLAGLIVLLFLWTLGHRCSRAVA